jgi:hypothetical protein
LVAVRLGKVTTTPSRSQPIASITRTSSSVDRVTTPLLLKARNESGPTLAAQSPVISPGCRVEVAEVGLAVVG